MSRSWRSEIGSLLTLAAPLVFAQLAQHGIAFVDTLMVGRLGPAPLAGIALGGAVLGFVYIVSMAFMLAVGPQVAQAVGAADKGEAARAARQGLWLAALVSLPAVLVLRNAGAWLVRAGQEPAVAEAAGGYLTAVSYGLPAALCYVALRGFLEGHGNTRPILLIALFSVGFNVFANYVLIYGHYGFPELGLAGAGYATSLVYAAMLALVVSYVARRYRVYAVFAGLLRPDPRMLRELFRVGWPISLTLGFEVGLFFATALLVGRFGEAPLAGHQIAIQTATLTFMMPLGIGAAVAVRVGQAVGRRDLGAARLSGHTGMAVAAAVMVVTAMVFLLAPMAVIGIYLNLADPANAAVIGFAASFLAIAGLFQVVDGIQVTAAGALRGLKDTRVPMLISLVSYWLVGMPTGLALAFGLGLGPRGLWFGLVVGLAAAALLLSLRFDRRTRSGRFGGATAGAPPGLVR